MFLMDMMSTPSRQEHVGCELRRKTGQSSDALTTKTKTSETGTISSILMKTKQALRTFCQKTHLMETYHAKEGKELVLAGGFTERPKRDLLPRQMSVL